MLPGLAFFGAFRVLGMYLWVKKKPQYGMVNNWLCLAATTGLSLVLIPHWGIFGAAAGNTLGLTTLSVLLGGHVRVGLEDNHYLERGRPATSNAELVARSAAIIEHLGRDLATPAEARERLGIY